MKYLKLILTIVLIIPLTGCYNYRELNDLGITTAIGITKENNEYKLIIEVLKTDKSTSEDAKTPKFVLYESNGKTIQEAVRNAILESPKRLYANHLYMLLIDEKLARDDISDIMDLFFRDPESRKQFYVLVTKEDIKEVLSTRPLLEDINAKCVIDRLEVNDKFLSNTIPITFSKLLTKYVNPHIEMVMPSLILEDSITSNEDDPKKKIVISNTAIFKNNKLVGYIDNLDTLYYNLIINDVDDTVITSLYNDKYITIEINNSNTKIDVKNKVFNIKIKLSGNIAEINNNKNLENDKTIYELERLFENDLNKNISSMINNVIDKYDSDIFGFTDLIYKKDYKNYSDNINLKDLKFNIDTTVTLKYKGNGAKGINE